MTQNYLYLHSEEALMLTEAGALLIDAGYEASGGPRNIGISMVKNESDIIELFVRHNLQYLDALVILDNGSTDGTDEILDALCHEGLPIVRLYAPRAGFHQDARMTNLMRTVSLFFSPTALFALDADEFIVTSSRASFCDQLASFQGNARGFLPWISYVPVQNSDNASEPNILKRIVHRRRCEDFQWYKVVVTRTINTNPHSMLHMGNHDVTFPGPTDSRVFPDIRLAHFPVRSSNQIQQKVIVNWLSMLAMGGHREGVAGHWDKLFQDFRKSDYAEVDITRVASQYAVGGPGDLVFAPVESIDVSLGLTSQLAKKSVLTAVVEFAKEILHDQQVVNRARGPNDPNGLWIPCDDPKLFVDFPPFEYLYRSFQPHSVLEVESRHDLYLRRFKDMGTKSVLAVGANADAKNAETKDCESGLANAIARAGQFELLLCLECPQWQDAVTSAPLIDAIANCASRAIVFSTPRKGQPGVPDCALPISHWIKEFEARGWVPLAFASLAFRASATLSWLRANPIVFTRRGADTAFHHKAFTTYNLEHQERIHWHWQKQKSGYYIRPHLGEEITISWAC